MCTLQMLSERINTGAVGHVESVKLDFGEPSISFERLGLLELSVLLEGFEGSFASALVTGCEV
jgi:hypothetical protein